jgi:hypothetical protein
VAKKRNTGKVFYLHLKLGLTLLHIRQARKRCALSAPVLRSRSVPTTTKVDSVKHLVLAFWRLIDRGSKLYGSLINLSQLVGLRMGRCGYGKRIATRIIV